MPGSEPRAPRRAFLATARDIRRAGLRNVTHLTSLQRTRLADLVAYARDRSPYYRTIYRRLPDGAPDLPCLPPVTKRDLMANFDDWATDRSVSHSEAEAFVSDPARLGDLFLGRYVAFATSGTTGNPAILLHDPFAVTVYAALAAVRRFPARDCLRFVWPILRCGARTATIVATGGHFASSVVEAMARRRHPRLASRNRTFSVLSPLPELVRSLNRLQPAVVGSYPTALTVLAREQAAGRLAIRPCLALTGAEGLSPAARQAISGAFGCPVRDTYAASEFMGIAFDCDRGRLHLNADWAILEPTDRSFRPVPPGTPSHTVLLTNLANRVQPLIRYDLGDSVTLLPDPCPCGSPLPALQVEGRRDEILNFPGTAGEVVPVLPMAIATVVEEVPGVRNWQAIRTGPSRISLRLDAAPGADAAGVRETVTRNLKGYLSAQGLADVAVDTAEELPRRDPTGGKLRQVYSEWSEDSSTGR